MTLMFGNCSNSNVHMYDLQLNYERERLKTFKDWPVMFLKPKILAAAGFYFLKREDVVKCIFCGVEIGQWQRGDIPMEEHLKWSPSCGFVLHLSVGNVPIKKPTLEQLGICKYRKPTFSNYSTLEARMRSFETWPIALKPTPLALSEAGFFYTGKADVTICFHCGGGLNDWEITENPWVQHAQWFSKCNFILSVKGKSFVDKVCGRNVILKPEEKSLNCTNIEDNKTENSTPEHLLCKICCIEELGIVSLPCGHIFSCFNCSFSLTKCAVCRQPVLATVRAFLS